MDSEVTYNDPTFGAVVLCYEWEYRLAFNGKTWTVVIRTVALDCNDRQPFLDSVGC